MAEQNAVATQQGTQLSVAAQVKSMISQDAVKKKFTEVLGQKAPQFLASASEITAEGSGVIFLHWKLANVSVRKKKFAIVERMRIKWR